MSLVVAGSLCACTDETTFTGEERALLAAYKLPTNPPPVLSNRFADDPRAAVLGKKFFFDPRFSGQLGVANDGVTNGSLGPAGTAGKVSCYGCHQVENGGTDHRSRPLATSLGVNYGLRNAPSVINAAYSAIPAEGGGGWQLWDGRKDSLWAVALGPLEGANEHNGTRLAYAHVVYDKYRTEYEAIFGPMPDLTDTIRFPDTGKPGQATFDGMAAADKTEINRFYANLGKAIEAYERRLISASFEPSPFDQMLAAFDKDNSSDEILQVMTPEAIRGAKLFIGKAACNECHRDALFSDYKFHNIGCPQTGQNVPTIDVGRSAGIAKLKADAFNRAGAFSDAPADVTQAYKDYLAADLVENPDGRDLGAFRTPSLRNIEKTAPFMHDGVYTTMWDVVAHYNFGGGTGTFSGTKEAAVSPLLLSDDEMDDLVAFLRSLSDGPPLANADFPEGLTSPPVIPQ